MEKQLINTAVEETWETTGDSLATAGSSLEGLIHNLHGFPSGAHRRLGESSYRRYRPP